MSAVKTQTLTKEESLWCTDALRGQANLLVARLRLDPRTRCLVALGRRRLRLARRQQIVKRLLVRLVDHGGQLPGRKR
jgi:hypothetical protein